MQHVFSLVTIFEQYKDLFFFTNMKVLFINGHNFKTLIINNLCLPLL